MVLILTAKAGGHTHTPTHTQLLTYRAWSERENTAVCNLSLQNFHGNQISKVLALHRACLYER